MKAIPNCKTQAEVEEAFSIIENCEYKNAKGLVILFFIAFTVYT